MISGILPIALFAGLFVLGCAVLAFQGWTAAKKKKRKRNRDAWTFGHTGRSSHSKRKSAARK